MSIHFCDLHGQQITDNPGKDNYRITLHKCQDCYSWTCRELYSSKYNICKDCKFNHIMRKLKSKKRKVIICENNKK